MVIGKGVLYYRSWQLSSDDDVRLMFTFHTQFLEIRIIEIFIILKESYFSSDGSIPVLAYVPVSQLVGLGVTAILVMRIVLIIIRIRWLLAATRTCPDT